MGKMTNKEMKEQMGRVLESFADGHWQASLYALNELRFSAEGKLKGELKRLASLYRTEPSHNSLYYSLRELHLDWDNYNKEDSSIII